MNHGATLALVSLTACASFSTMSTARNLPAGGVQVYVAPHVLGTGRHDPPSTAPPPDEHGTPTTTTPEPPHTTPGKLGGAVDLDLEIGARYGLSDDVSVAARLWALGGAAEGQLQLRRSATPDSGVDLALGAGASYSGSRDDGKLLLLYAPLLVGLNTSGGSQLVLSPKLALAYLMRTENNSAILLAGASVGYSYKVVDGFSLLPELSVMAPIVTPADRFTWYGVVFEAGLGFMFGRPRDARIAGPPDLR